MKSIRLINSGLSGSAIKYIALVMMVIDHLYQVFASHGIPSWFHWIGRPVLPIFLFMCAEAFWYTKSRKRYLLQLFIGFEFMSICNYLISIYSTNYNIYFMNNVFQTLFLAAFYMMCIELLRSGIHEKKNKKKVVAVLLMLLPIITSLLFLLLLPSFPNWLRTMWLFIPNLLLTEGGFSAVILGTLFYIFREKRIIQVLIIIVFGILSLILTLTRGIGLFSGSPQWLLIFAIIPILLYNDKRGIGNKYFFYIFYPAHIYLLFFIAWLL